MITQRCKCSFHLTFSSWEGACCAELFAVLMRFSIIGQQLKNTKCSRILLVLATGGSIHKRFANGLSIYNSWGLRKTKVSQSTHRKGTHWKGQLFEFPAIMIEFSHLDPPMLSLQHEFPNVRMLTQNFACVGCALNPRPVVATLVPVKLILDILVQRSLGAFLFMFTYCMTVCQVESWYSKCTVLLEPLLQ